MNQQESKPAPIIKSNPFGALVSSDEEDEDEDEGVNDVQ